MARTTYPTRKYPAASGVMSSWMPRVTETAAPATNSPIAANSDQT